MPALDLRLGFPDAGTNPAGSTTRAAYDLVADGFGPGANGPLVLVADIETPGALAAFEGALGRVADDPSVVHVGEPVLSRDGDAALATAVPSSSPQSAATAELVERLRGHTLDGEMAGSQVLVGGATAAFVDQADFVSDRLGLFIGVVVGLSLLVLLAALRAPVLAAKAAILNLLSVGAAYGVVALAASGGVLGGMIGLDSETPVAPFIPVIMFALLFGLSMDYEVFLLSRVREEYLRRGDSAEAVVEGLARTARVITAAAAIMVVVFLAFVTADEAFLRLMGLGMAAAILVDATVIRMVLVPSVMQLLGRAAWWSPTWLSSPRTIAGARGGSR